jgi:radical SAM superfamily enzyme YgiQ (UPF0313 family)
MKVLLIEPAKAPRTIGGEDVFLYEPLALEYVAAGVAADHDVRILDMRLDKDLEGVLDSFSPDVVGITAFTVHVSVVLRLCREIKEWNPGAFTVVGGHHATILPGDFMSPTIDLIVMGPGVNPFREVVRRLEREEALEGIPGTAYREGERLVRTEPGPEVDLDGVPFPDRRFTAAYRHRYFSEWMKPLASVRTSKGCPYRCNFCALWKLAGGRYLKRQPEKVVEELAGLDEEYVFFADDESLVDARRMRRLAELIREAGLRKRYFLYGRSDTIARNRDLLELWREIGLERVFVGLESFRDEDLEEIGKDSTLADNEKAVGILQDLGIEIYASLMVRQEYGTEDFAALAQYCRDLDLEFATFAVLTPLPGTNFYAEVQNQMITHDYDLFDFLHTLLPTTLPLKEFYEEMYRLNTRAISVKNQLAFARRIPLRDLPHLMLASLRVFRRLRKAYLDYGEESGPAS